ncbi:MAG: hypothetical protein WAV73_03850 [Candidatus Moraniibacteriota bacterium]
MKILFGIAVLLLGVYIMHKKKEKELRELKKCLGAQEIELLKMEKRKVSVESIDETKENIEAVRGLIEKLS